MNLLSGIGIKNLDTCATVASLVPKKIMGSADEMPVREMMFPVELFSSKVWKRSRANLVFAVLSCSMSNASAQLAGWGTGPGKKVFLENFNVASCLLKTLA